MLAKINEKTSRISLELNPRNREARKLSISKREEIFEEKFLVIPGIHAAANQHPTALNSHHAELLFNGAFELGGLDINPLQDQAGPPRGLRYSGIFEAIL